MIKDHPEGLKVLFLTEMWERMSYYGMRGLLVLFMTSSISDGGLNLTNISASAIYGIYASMVYLFALPGGWIGDRILGQQKAILIGGIIIALGHFTLILPSLNTFFLGLLFVVLGTGLLKPNISAIVGGLYEENDSLRDSGFTLFYMAINIGSILGFFVCGYLGEKIGWHYGFGAAGLGMLFGLFQFITNKNKLNKVGLSPLLENIQKKDVVIVFFCIALIFVISITGLMGLWFFDPVPLAKILSLIITGITVLYFIYILTYGKLSNEEFRRVILIIFLFFGAALFWSGFDQAGSSFNIFAYEYTNRNILGWQYPASWLQILNPVFVVILSPFMAALWIFLGKKMMDPNLPFKFGLGLIFMAVGFLIIAIAAELALNQNLVGAQWLLLTYLFHTIGELMISPIGLAAISRLSPKRYIGQMMGVWFLASSLGAIIAGILSGEATGLGLQSMPGLFNKIFTISSISGLVLLLISYPLSNWALSKNKE
jgi:proton-dependent oligopeptide transporter, POT family